MWNVEAYACENGLLSARSATFEQAGSQRWSLVNVLAESTSSTTELLIIGETGPSELRDSVIENVTLVGSRWNWHNDCELVSPSNDGFAVRVNTGLNGGRTIRVGLMAHGLSTGDTIGISGFAGSNGANLNVAGAEVTVLDPNRFEYTAAAPVVSAAGIGGSGSLTYVTGAMAGQPNRPILRPNLRHIGNVIRCSSFDRNGTKHDLFNNAAHLTGSWELLYGVGFRGNVNANRGTASFAQFQHAFYGIGSDVELDFSAAEVPSRYVNWHGYVSDRSRDGPEFPNHSNNGDYRASAAVFAPFGPSRLLGRGTGPAVTDQDGRGGMRSAMVDAGALGRFPDAVAAASLRLAAGFSVHRAVRATIGWAGALRAGGGRCAMQDAGAALTPADAPRAQFERLVRVGADASGIRVDQE